MSSLTTVTATASGSTNALPQNIFEGVVLTEREQECKQQVLQIIDTMRQQPSNGVKFNQNNKSSIALKNNIAHQSKITLIKSILEKLGITGTISCHEKVSFVPGGGCFADFTHEHEDELIVTNICPDSPFFIKV